ncbi:MAG: hypothetical protein ACYC3Q_14945, partial [Gemmatimonadaceae bacterium]
TVSARTVEMASFSEDGLPVTSEMEAAPRRSQAGRSIAQAAAIPEDASPLMPAEPAHAAVVEPGAPRMSPMVGAGVMPRGRGRWIAGVLLALLIAGGAWYLWHTAKKVVPRDGAPPAPAGAARA